MKKLPKYLFYATLLDSFQGLLSSSEIYQKYWGFSEEPPKSEEEFEKEQFQSLIDRINRVPIDSEAADRGTVFNEIVDCIIEKRNSEKIELVSDKPAGTITAKYNNRTFVFSLTQCREVANDFQAAITQYRTSAIMETKYGPVELYGFLDELMPQSVHDIKVKGKYSAFDFKNNWQHRVYPYCLNEEGIFINDFAYNIYVMDKNNIIKERHEEIYCYVPERDIPKIREHCERLIEFIETNKALITDKKIFNQHEQTNE